MKETKQDLKDNLDDYPEKRIIEGKQPESLKQFKIYKTKFGWVVSEARKIVKKRWFRDDVVSWEYEVISAAGKFIIPIIYRQRTLNPFYNSRHTPFRTKEKAEEWLRDIVKQRREKAVTSEEPEIYFNEKDLIK